MRPSPVFIALTLALPATAGAQEAVVAAAADGATEFDRITVTATRTERRLQDVPNTVDVILREDMDRHVVRDLKDLFRYEPGVSVTSSFGRFGVGGIRIRGLEGNRVRIQTDGIPVSDAFSIGSFSNANRNFVDLDTLKRVEVVRGPSSSLYGSDALGGTVSFITKDPSDYLGEGRDAYFGFKLGYESDWNGLFGGATAAFGGDRWSGLVAVGHRQGRETENQGEIGGEGSARTQPNPQERDGRSVLSKLVYAPSERQRFKLTVEGNEDAAGTELLTSRGLQPMTGANTLSLTGDDHQSRARVSLAHEFEALDAAFADALDWQVYRQDSETTQDTDEFRIAPGTTFPVPMPARPQRRQREFNFDQRVHGVQANVRKSVGSGVRHDFAYGLDLSRTRTRQKRDGLATWLDTGQSSPVVSPDSFPVRDFPNSRTTSAALYAQDEIAFAEGRIRLVPAVRVDHYRLEPEVDAIFREDNPGVAVEEISETAISPKLGAVWHLGDRWSLFGGYARGFRAPPYNDVNIGFTNLQFGYTAIPNPDLEPETSDGLEAGLRFAGDAAHASLSAHYTRYEDFIESSRQVGFDPTQGPFGLVIFQSQNVDTARIYGLEFSGGLDLGALSDGWEGWSLRAAAAWSRGKGRGPEQVEVAPDEFEEVVMTRRLESIDPVTAALGLRYDRDAWGMELAGRYAGQRDLPDPLPVASGPQPVPYFESPSHAVLDLYAHWNIAPGARLDAGIFNLGDRKYWDAGDMALIAANSATLDRYTAPGRNLAISFAVEW
jgi:hemoglobin/transferrin/lactoferrin receptor protein